MIQVTKPTLTVSSKGETFPYANVNTLKVRTLLLTNQKATTLTATRGLMHQCAVKGHLLKRLMLSFFLG